MHSMSPSIFLYFNIAIISRSVLPNGLIIQVSPSNPHKGFSSPSNVLLYVPPGLLFKNSTWCSLCVECFVRISEQTATFALYITNWLVFITVVESVYSAVRNDSLYRVRQTIFYVNLLLKLSLSQSILITSFTSGI